MKASFIIANIVGVFLPTISSVVYCSNHDCINAGDCALLGCYGGCEPDEKKCRPNPTWNNFSKIASPHVSIPVDVGEMFDISKGVMYTPSYVRDEVCQGKMLG